MMWLRRVFRKAVRRRHLQAELEAELAFHKAMAAINDNAVPLGNLTVVKEGVLDLWRFNLLENIWRDIVLALRRLRRNPAYTVSTIGSLALGIGISTAMFALLNTVVFRPLPYAQEGSLVWTTEVLKANSTDELTLTADFLDWQRLNHTFESMAGFNYPYLLVCTGLDRPFEVNAARASASLFGILKVKPILGRPFLPSEDHAGGGHVAVISHPFWRDHFGSSPSALGKPVLLDGEPYAIVGILPKGFVFPGDRGDVQVITPLARNVAGELARDGRVMTILHDVVGRLKPGITVAQAHDDLAAIQAHLPVPPFHPTIIIRVLPLRTHLFGDQKTTATVLVLGSVLFLLLAAANLGNLALSQLMQRDQELAIRRALGAARTRVIAQLLMENAVLAAFACLAGIGVAVAIRDLVAAMPQYETRLYAELPIDANVLLFTGEVLAAVMLLFGLVPALRVSDVELRTTMAAGQASVAGRRFHLRYLSFVAVVEIAIVVALSSSAALTLKSFWNQRYTGLGIRTEHLVSANLNLSAARYTNAQQQTAFVDALLARASAISGVEQVAASLAFEIPPGGGHATNNSRIEGRPLPATSRHKALMRNQEVSAAYFKILRIPLIAGRFLSDNDRSNSTPVVVVSREYARRYFQHETAIGHRVQAGERDGVWYTIVGVVGDVKSGGLASTPEPIVYTPYDQSEYGRLRQLGVILQSSLPVSVVGPSLRNVVAGIDPEQPVSSIQSLDERLDESSERPRFTADLLTVLSLLGIVLATIGVYGLTSCKARSQMREIAVRRALGAPSWEILRNTAADAILVSAVGLFFGLLLAVGSLRVISSMLFQVDWRSPVPLIAVCSSVFAAAIAASLVPAWKASRADPLLVLRES